MIHRKNLPVQFAPNRELYFVKQYMPILNVILRQQYVCANAECIEFLFIMFDILEHVACQYKGYRTFKDTLKSYIEAKIQDDGLHRNLVIQTSKPHNHILVITWEIINTDPCIDLQRLILLKFSTFQLQQ